MSKSADWSRVTERAYSSLENAYQSFSLKRQNYLSAVDDFVLKHLDLIRKGEILDIGSGDGQRLWGLAKQTPDKVFFALEPSSLYPSGRPGATNVSGTFYQCHLEELDQTKKWEACLMLWNVLGHMENPEKSLEVVHRILTPGGTLLLDVNNQFNVRQYGAINVLRNFLFSSWDQAYPLRLGEREINVRLFKPQGLITKLEKIGFKVEELSYIDYEMGMKRRSFLHGQVVISAIKMEN